MSKGFLEEGSTAPRLELAQCEGQVSQGWRIRQSAGQEVPRAVSFLVTNLAKCGDNFTPVISGRPSLCVTTQSFLHVQMLQEGSSSLEFTPEQLCVLFPDLLLTGWGLPAELGILVL